MERRRLLQALAALGVASSPALDALRDIQESVEGAVAGPGRDGHLEEWEGVLEEYGYSYPQKTAEELVLSLASDLVAVQQIMARLPRDAPHRSSWCRVTAGLSALLAKTLSNLGQTRAARTWWRTAQRAAANSGDNDLCLWVGGEWLIHGLYEKRPTPLLIKEAGDLLARFPSSPCRGLVKVYAVRAQLLASEHRETAAIEDEAISALRRCTEAFGDLPDSMTGSVRSIASWGEDRLRYTEAYVYAHLGKTTEAERAVTRTHELLPACSPPWRVHVQAGLLRALAHVRAGDVSAGIALAHAEYERCWPDRRTTMITSIAGQVLASVPSSSITAPAVEEYRESLAPTAQRKAIT